MIQPSLPTIKKLFAYSQIRCAFPQCDATIVEDSGTITGIICHIKARRPGGPRYDPHQTAEARHGFQNLILMCGRHAKIIDSDPRQFTGDLLQEIKAIHEGERLCELSRADAEKAELLFKDYRAIYIKAARNVVVNRPSAVHAEHVTIKTAKQRVNVLPPEGSIGSRVDECRYVQHLIQRYQDFASRQPQRRAGGFKFPAIYSAINKRYGVRNWKLIPLTKFDDVCSYLQARIDRTWLGRVSLGKNYSTFADFCTKY